MMNRPVEPLDEGDLPLVHALQIGPRLPWTVLGEILDQHPTSLAARWRRLEDSGSAWITAHPLGHPDQMALSFHDVRCRPGHRRAVAAAIGRIPEVFSVEECHRDRDFMLTVITPDPAQLTDVVYPQLEDIPQLSGYESTFCTRLHRTATDWELDALNPGQRRDLRAAVGPPPAPTAHADPLLPSLGPIARILGRNGRASAAQVAAASGLHPATARRRLQRVLSSGILSFRCDVSHRAAGYPVMCQWFARLPAADHDAAAAELARLGALRICASTTGRSNFMFMTWHRAATDIMAMERRASEKLPRLEIRETVIISNIPKRAGWHLDTDGRRQEDFVEVGHHWQ
ncbi:Lrp/AsnC family transcriptional regulator [Citricoccus sp.]|uniref:Lrp/AsnC family transcriptional regulator n=2 Tax=Citricoccus sp. TaxID=1978372 RepID=UPI0028BEC682|nr:Lrp/AsnC family transcriptional regulator [Citricoccus sp.]